MGIIDDIRRRAANSLSAWANGSNEDISADEMIKALQQRGLAEPTEEKPKAMFFDPYAINDWGGWRQRPSSLTYEALRHMSMTCAPLAAIIQLRTNQMAQFARPQQGKYDKGYRVILRDRRDRNRSMTPVEKKRAMEIERMIETTGVLQTGERARDRDSFRTFMKKGLRDTLTYDQFAFEKLSDREGRVSRFIALPSETIRPAVLDVEHADIAEMRSRVSYVQVYENTVIAEFAYDDLAWCIMNPRSDLRTNGFGFSPIEQIVRLVTAWLFGFQYNQNFFCISPDALITTDRGLIPVAELVGEEFKIWNGRAWSNATGYEAGKKPAVRTKLVNGLELTTSQKHLFRVIPFESETGLPEWREQRALKAGDVVLTGYVRVDVALDYEAFFAGKRYETDRSTGHAFVPTKEMVDDPGFWEMIGFALGDGYWPHGRVGKFGIYPHHEKDAELFPRFSAVLTKYGINFALAQQKLSYETKAGNTEVPVIHVQHKAFVSWLYELGFRTSAEDRAIPRLFFRQPAWIREALLRGLFSADGCTRTHVTGYRTPTVFSRCPSFRQDILSCLWSVGVASDEGGRGWSRAGEIRVQDIDAFVERIGYLQEYKNAGISRQESTKHRWDTLHTATATAVSQQLKQHPEWLTLEQRERGQLSQVLAGDCGLSRPRAIAMMKQLGIEIPEALYYVHCVVDVLDTKPSTAVAMFDIEVFDEDHVFLANHMAVHNTQGSAVKGLLNIKGTIPDKQMRAFRRQWYSMVSGVENCLSAETPIWTSEGAFEIGRFLGDEIERETRLWTGTEWKPALVYRTQAKQPMRTVLGNGSALVTSADHRFRVLNADGLPDWRRQEDLRVGDFVFVNKQILSQQAATPLFSGKQATPELFEALGWMVGDGYFAHGGRGHAKTNIVQWFYSADTESLIRDRHFAILQGFAENVVRKDLVLTEAEAVLICEQYGFESVCTLQISLQVCSVDFCEELLRLGFTASKKAEGGKTVPPLLHALPAEYRVAFLRGLFSADGNNAKLRSPKFTITNDRLRAQTRLLLASLGIRTALSEGKSKVTTAGRFRGRVQKPSYLEIKDRDAFFALIQPLQDHKQPKPLAKPNEANKCSRVAVATVLHFLRQVREVNAASNYALLTRQERMDLNSILVGQDGCSLPRLLRFMAKASVPPPEWLTQHYFEPVVSVERVDSDPIPMFDVQIYDDLHAFAANGVITHNSWRTPILNSEDIQWISMHSNNREMEFSAWMDWITKLICAVFGVDPLEINFQFGNTGQSSSLNTGDQESKLAESKDKGLRPLSDHFTDVVNSHLIWDLAPDFEFSFGGMFGSGEEADREALSKDGSTYKTVNEIRAQEDMAALPGEQGKAILNSTWIQWALQKDAAAQQAQQGGDPSQEPGQPPGAGATGPAQPDEEPDDNLLHQDGQAPPWAAQSDDEGDDQLISQQAKKSARDIARFATNELRKAHITRVVHGTEQTIEIRED